MVSIRRMRHTSTLTFQRQICMCGLLSAPCILLWLLMCILLWLLMSTTTDYRTMKRSIGAAKDIANKIVHDAAKEQTGIAPEQTEHYPCPTTKICATQEMIDVQMVAMPHTATSSTSSIFGRDTFGQGFTCSGTNATVHERCPQALKCALSRFQYHGKQHASYNSLAHRRNALFTVLRDPYQFVLSQYRERKTWDKQWYGIYPSTSLENVTVAEWTEKAWWRHNLFTKMLATDTHILWASKSFGKQSKVNPDKRESDYQNSQLQESKWLQKALQRVGGMPVFGLHDRLDEYFDLLSYTFCVPRTTVKDKKREPRPVSDELARVVQQRFGLDLILFEKAKQLFNEMLAEMKNKKENGILCNLNRVLNSSTAQAERVVGLFCSNE